MLNSTVFSPSHDEPKRQTKSEPVLRHQSFEENDTSSNTDKSLKTAFPELQNLPESLKMPIRKFLQKRISDFQSSEDVPRKLKLLAEATESLDDEAKNIEIGDDETQNRQPKYSILETASVVGNRFLIEVLIEAGMDVTALDEHSWTALMIAKAGGHKICADVLSRHMETIGANSSLQPPSPSGLITLLDPGIVLFAPDNLTASLYPQDAVGRLLVYIYGNHPIPIESCSFYYEISILKTGPRR